MCAHVFLSHSLLYLLKRALSDSADLTVSGQLVLGNPISVSPYTGILGGLPWLPVFYLDSELQSSGL